MDQRVIAFLLLGVCGNTLLVAGHRLAAEGAFAGSALSEEDIGKPWAFKPVRKRAIQLAKKMGLGESSYAIHHSVNQHVLKTIAKMHERERDATVTSKFDAFVKSMKRYYGFNSPSLVNVLLNMPFNLAVGPLPHDRTNDPGEEFDARKAFPELTAALKTVASLGEKRARDWNKALWDNMAEALGDAMAISKRLASNGNVLKEKVGSGYLIANSKSWKKNRNGKYTRVPVKTKPTTRPAPAYNLNDDEFPELSESEFPSPKL